MRNPIVRPKTGNPRRSPAGFTLIELLVVIVILAMLIGLLVPAVMRAVGRAREAAAAAEIQALAQALAQFKSRYGEYPPSRIVISENGDYSSGTLGGLAPLASRSMAALKRYWPRLSLSSSGAPGNIPGGFYDVNGDNRNQSASGESGPYLLSGPECLVFFLGGIPQQTGGGWAMTGFSKNPANPFQNSITTNNRIPADYEFNNGRLVTNTLNPFPPTGGFPGYVDSLSGAITNPLNPQIDSGYAIPFYAYFSAYGGAGYDPGDCDLVNASNPGETDSISGQTLQGVFSAPGAIILGTSPATYPMIASPAPNPYTSSCPVQTGPGGAPVTPATKPRAWINTNSFQIISPGLDRYYGLGGQYVQSGTTRLPFVDGSSGYTSDTLQTQQANAALVSPSVENGIRSRESDNIASFSAGKLD